MVRGLLALAHINIANWLATIVFLSLFAFIIAKGIRYIDLANRSLMFIKLSSFFLLILFLLPHDSIAHLNLQGSLDLNTALMPIVMAFGFAIIIPSLCTYLDRDKFTIKKATLIGSLFPLFAYLLWIFSVQASVDHQTLLGLVHSKQAVSGLANMLNHTIHADNMSFLANVFVSICITTSFLGVSMALSDFLSDGFNIKRVAQSTPLGVLAISFIPPTLIVLLKPGIFILILKYAGILCVVLLMLLSTLMAWSACYVKKIIAHPPRYCAKPILALNALLSVSLLVFAASH